jgi:putative tryptophan/tyrosine transport system substrate-binding protein
MKRRRFITLFATAAVWPQRLLAQQKVKIWRVGFLAPSGEAFASGQKLMEPWVNKMRALGYAEGQNLIIDARYARGNIDLLPGLARELVALKPDVIIGSGTPAIDELRKLSSTIPLVMAPVNDPVGSGFVKSLASPGGNITGMANMSTDYLPKTLELVRELIPDAKRVAILMSANVAHPAMYQTLQKAASSIGVDLVGATASTETDLDAAFASMAKAKCDAVIVLSDPPRPRIVTLSAAARIPAVYQDGQYVNEGGLAGYGPEFGALIAQAATYVDRILKGARAADLPVEQPTVFLLKINLKTAKALGLTVSPLLLNRADQVIE